MQLGKALVGAIIGGLLGIGLCIAVYYLADGFDKPWLAIPVAILTGLGVRALVQTKGHPSYARGGLTAIVAVLAFLAFYPVVAQLTTRTAARPIAAQGGAARPAEGPADDAADEPAVADAPVEEVATDQRRDLAPAAMRKQRQQPWSVVEVIALGLAAFIAYELGRGSGVVRPGTADGTMMRDEQPAPLSAAQTMPPAD
jgi:hypothetical protein